MEAAPEQSISAATRHAKALLAMLGVERDISVASGHPALGWRRAGLMAVTGPGLVAPAALTSAADGALAALGILTSADLPRGAALLGERARLLGLKGQGATSPNGSCRLIAARGGHFALNLPRDEDWTLAPALVGQDVADWAEIETAAAHIDRDALVAQGRLLGLAIAADAPVSTPAAPFAIVRYGQARRQARAPLVVDLSSLWAGPLAASLLQAAGARVVKIESMTRPDGARQGHPGFYDLLNAGKASVALDFADPGDVRHLQALVAEADIVIEASRPRALAGLGLVAEQVASRGAVWLSITAHGRTGEAASWIGFGDDAAVAGGLSAAMAAAWGRPLIAGDAIADPLTGITAALAAQACWQTGGGHLISVPMAQVVAHAIAIERATDVHDWQRIAEADTAPFYPLRTVTGQARRLGADTAQILAQHVSNP